MGLRAYEESERRWSPVLTSGTWSQMSGMRDYFLSKQDYLKSQVGNPEGADKPNKSEWRCWRRQLLPVRFSAASLTRFP